MTMHYRHSRGALAMLVIVLPVWLFNAMKVWRCSRHDWPAFLKVHEIFPKIKKKVTFPPWLPPVKIWHQRLSG